LALPLMALAASTHVVVPVQLAKSIQEPLIY